mmetsp:Transcript_2001/g.5085  ORF Transcript_2001/g.5085 Transcript_2001/m.5085 type:complete len:218 (-) Transcript_2001:34-687(-)
MKIHRPSHVDPSATTAGREQPHSRRRRPGIQTRRAGPRASCRDGDVDLVLLEPGQRPGRIVAAPFPSRGIDLETVRFGLYKQLAFLLVGDGVVPASVVCQDRGLLRGTRHHRDRLVRRRWGIFDGGREHECHLFAVGDDRRRHGDGFLAIVLGSFGHADVAREFHEALVIRLDHRPGLVGANFVALAHLFHRIAVGLFTDDAEDGTHPLEHAAAPEA